ncbi:hypothetical protein GCM10017712_23300 [Curtobacterium citreum]
MSWAGHVGGSINTVTRAIVRVSPFDRTRGHRVNSIPGVSGPFCLRRRSGPAYREPLVQKWAPETSLKQST